MIYTLFDTKKLVTDKKISLAQALKKEDKFHPGYLFAPKDCKHESIETIMEYNKMTWGCYNCGIGFWSKPFKTPPRYER